jgi:hypothetical protein
MTIMHLAVRNHSKDEMHHTSEHHYLNGIYFNCINYFHAFTKLCDNAV